LQRGIGPAELGPVESYPIHCDHCLSGTPPAFGPFDFDDDGKPDEMFDVLEHVCFPCAERCESRERAVILDTVYPLGERCAGSQEGVMGVTGGAERRAILVVID